MIKANTISLYEKQRTNASCKYQLARRNYVGVLKSPVLDQELGDVRGQKVVDMSSPSTCRPVRIDVDVRVEFHLPANVELN